VSQNELQYNDWLRLLKQVHFQILCYDNSHVVSLGLADTSSKHNRL